MEDDLRYGHASRVFQNFRETLLNKAFCRCIQSTGPFVDQRNHWPLEKQSCYCYPLDLSAREIPLHVSLQQTIDV